MPTTLLELAARSPSPSAAVAAVRAVAVALRSLHRRGRVHAHLAPRRVRVDLGAGVAELDEPPPSTDWLAAHQPDELPYAAPELLQPSLRAADPRADLYALGALLYELLVGAPPFAADDLLGWTHAHVAQAPRSPAERDPRVPPPLADICLKLLAKSVDERYQSVAGLLADLDRWRERGDAQRFPLGQHDVAEQLRVSQKLYGRSPELAVLQAARERVAQRGAPELVLVRGASGVGKSALVAALQRGVAGDRGLFVAGKFDQYQRDIPHATLVQAFGELVRRLLAASEERLAEWRRRLQAELGGLGQLVIDVVPQVELVIGPQPPVPAVPVIEAQHRFNRVLRQFIGVFAQPEHPLVLFLDDLQWADAASVRLLQHLLTHGEVDHLLVVCAYRDGEIDANHPWTAALEEIQRGEVRVSDLAVGPLPPAQIAALLHDTLRCEHAAATQLARVVHNKTAGNPFFVGQFLTNLAAEGLLRFDAEAGAWQWNLDEIVGAASTDNIVDLMLGRLRGLPAGARRALSLAACAGAQVAPATLAALLGETEAAVLADLEPALAAELAVVQGGKLQFAHDRVQQAAYSLTPEAERAGLHLRIGRELRGAPGDAVAPERLFEVVNHLNAAVALISDPAERLALARLDLEAGRRAKRANAYASARIYLTAGLGLLPADAWTREHDLAFDLRRDLSECAYLCNDNAEAERLFAEILAHARDAGRRAEVYTLQISLYYAVGRMQESLAVGLQALRELGVDIPDGPEARGALFGAMIEAAVARFSALDIDGLEHPNPVADPQRRIAAHLMVSVIPAAFYLDIVLFSLIILHLVETSLLHGETTESVVGYAMFALLLVTVLGEHEMSGRIARMTLRRIAAEPDPGVHTKVRTLYGWFTGPWHAPLPELLGHLRAGYQAGVEAGDLSSYAAFALLGQDTLSLCRDGELARVEDVWRRHQPMFAQMQHEIAIQTVGVVLDQLPRLRDPGVHPPEASPAALAGSALGTHHYLRMQRLYLLGDTEGAAAAAERFLEAKGNGLLGTFLGADGDFYAALTAAAASDAAEGEHREALRARLRVQAANFATLAARCPANFLARAELLAAELARVDGRPAEALPHLEAAARAAADDAFVAVEAVAWERAGEVARGLGLALAAGAYFERARAVYVRWGAAAKVRQLEARTPELVHAAASPAAQWLSVDALAVVKATQALSGELEQDRLLGTLMHIVLAHAGAQTGQLLLVDRDRLVVAASARTEPAGVQLTLPAPRPAVRAEDLALAVVHYVRRTREHVLLADAGADAAFAGDPHLARAQVRSLLCVPIVRSGNLLGVLYLENNWMTGAFTPQRLAVLELLLTQAAISLEITALYADLARENRERRLVEHGLRESEERLRQLVEGAGAIPWETDLARGRLVYVGPQAPALLGYPHDRLVGQPDFLASITHPDDREALVHHLTSVAADERHDLEFRVRAADGAELWLHSISAAAGAAGQPRLRRGFMFDATARKRIEADLKQQLDIIAAQQEAIRRLSTPIIEVWHGVVMMPLFGSIDHAQAMQMQETLLSAITRTRARAAILDLTGVDVVDTGTAQHIVGLVRAVRLLGARGIVVGIRSEVAQAIVALGVDLARITTLANVREALVLCMQSSRAPAR